MKLKLFPYNMGSAGAKALAQALEAIRVFPDRGYRHYRNHLVINWGNSTPPAWYQESLPFLNKPEAVALATNKRKTLQTLMEKGVATLEFTTIKTIAQHWLDMGYRVFGRKTLTGTGGAGIIIMNEGQITEECPLYTKGVKKDKEFRVHVFNGEVIDFQQKKKRHGFTGGTTGIRNHENGWVFTRTGVELPEAVKTESIKAVTALGLDFGGVDVCTTLDGKVAVLEVNTAPGIEETTVNSYKNAILSYLENHYG